VAISEIVQRGEGNRLGHGARCSGDGPIAKRRRKGRHRARKKYGINNARGERVATYVLHQGEFDRASGKLKNLAQSAIWRREVAAEHALLSTVSRKTMRVDRLSEYHRVAGEVAEKCWENRSKKRIARAAFGVWSRSTAALDGFWASVLRGRERDGTLNLSNRTVLGYGNGKWGAGRAPTKRVRDSADRVFGRARVIGIDEFNTTKTCHVCGDVLQGIVDRKKNYKGGRHAAAFDRGLKHCARQSCSSYFDRDVNAALNILKVLIAQLRGEERPPHLRRDSVLSFPLSSSLEIDRRRPVRRQALLLQFVVPMHHEGEGLKASASAL
jgi:hypothetical protein